MVLWFIWSFGLRGRSGYAGCGRYWVFSKFQGFFSRDEHILGVSFPFGPNLTHPTHPTYLTYLTSNTTSSNTKTARTL